MAMCFDGVAMRFFRVFMGLGGMLVGLIMVAFFVMFRGCVVGLGGVLVVLCCFPVRFVCHVYISSWVSPKQLEPMLGRALFRGYNDTVN
jgi:hypothetical protein